MLETIIFDWSGVISNDITPVYHSCMKVLEVYGVETFNQEEFKKRSKNPHELFWKDHIKSPDIVEIRALFRKFMEKEEKPKILPGAKDTLEYLYANGKKLFVLSSHPQHFVEREAYNYKIKHLFVDLLGEKYDKAKGLYEMMHRYNLKKNSTLFVEDMTQGLIAGKENGLKTAGVLSGYHNEEHFRSLPERYQPDYIFKDITELKSLFG